MHDGNCLGKRDSFPDNPVVEALLRSAQAIANRVEECAAVLVAMIDLREGYDDAEGALSAICGLRSILLLHLSWEMLTLLADEQNTSVWDLFDEIDELEPALLLVEALYGDDLVDEDGEIDDEEFELDDEDDQLACVEVDDGEAIILHLR
jgi:hypothetical protein